MFDRILNATLSEEKVSIFGVTEGNLKLLLPTDSLDSYQKQNNRMISWTDPMSSFP